jgi:hypothetical protein
MSVDLEALKTTISNLQALRKTLQEQAQAGLKDAFKQFLVAFPQVKVIVWSQYTPYFNDGEECVFRVNEPIFSPASPDTDADRPYDFEELEDDLAPFSTYHKWSYKEVPNPHYKPNSPYSKPTYNKQDQDLGYKDSRMTPELEKAMDSIACLIQSDELEDAMRSAFDNHVWVKAYLKDGEVVFDVEEYDHD